MRYFAFILIVISSLNFAQTQWADTVISFTPGTNTTFGQDSDYFPSNILGAPDTVATYNSPSAVPEEILSLGFGGEIILKFTDNAIVNIEGPDFIIFENAFEIQFGPRAGEIFAEPAKVAVSKDGITFYEFPYDSTTLVGCAGVTPTSNGKLHNLPDSCGGDVFDLEDIPLDTAWYVKISDISQFVQSTPTHPYFDFSINGFDLDAVIALEGDPVVAVEANRKKEFSSGINIISGSPNPVNLTTGNRMTLKFSLQQPEFITADLFNILGERVKRLTEKDYTSGLHLYIADFSGLGSGVYFIRFSGKTSYTLHKVLVVK